MEKVSTDVLIEFLANSRQLKGGPSTGDGQLFLILGLTTQVPAGLGLPQGRASWEDATMAGGEGAAVFHVNGRRWLMGAAARTALV